MADSFFQGSVWAALTGTVTLLSAIIPVIAAMSKKIESGPMGAARANARSSIDSKIGCGGILKFSLLNSAIFVIYSCLMCCILVLSMMAVKALGTSYWNVIKEQYSSLESFAKVGVASCCASLAWYILVGGCVLHASVVSIRRGFEFGIFTMVIGLNITIIPLAAALAWTYWDVYIALSYGLSSALTSLAIVIMTRLISREIYSQ